MIHRVRNLLFQNKLFKDSAIYVLGAIFLKGVSFVLIPVYTKTFTPEQFGSIELVNTIINISVILTSFGLLQYFYMVFLKEDTNGKQKLVSDINVFFNTISFPLCILIGIVSTFCIDIGQFNFYYKAALSVLIAVIIYLTISQSLLYNVLQLQRNALKLTINKIVTGILLLILSWFFVTKTSIGIASIFLATVIAFSVSVLMIRHNKLKDLKSKSDHDVFELNKFRSYLQKSYPFVITSLSYFALSGVDKFIVKIVLGASSLGIYSVAFKFSSVFEPLLIAPILSAYTPHVFGAYQKNKRLPRQIYFLFLTLCFVLLASVITPILAKDFIDERYVYSTKLIPYLIGGFGFVFLAQAAAVPILYFQKTNVLLANVFIAGFLNIILNVILSYAYGLPGVSYAFLASNFLWYLITIFQARRIKNLVHV